VRWRSAVEGSFSAPIVTTATATARSVAGTKQGDAVCEQAVFVISVARKVDWIIGTVTVRTERSAASA